MKSHWKCVVGYALSLQPNNELGYNRCVIISTANFICTDSMEGLADLWGDVETLWVDSTVVSLISPWGQCKFWEGEYRWTSNSSYIYTQGEEERCCYHWRESKGTAVTCVGHLVPKSPISSYKFLLQELWAASRKSYWWLQDFVTEGGWYWVGISVRKPLEL